MFRSNETLPPPPTQSLHRDILGYDKPHVERWNGKIYNRQLPDFFSPINTRWINPTQGLTDETKKQMEERFELVNPLLKLFSSATQALVLEHDDEWRCEPGTYKAKEATIDNTEIKIMLQTARTQSTGGDHMPLYHSVPSINFDLCRIKDPEAALFTKNNISRRYATLTLDTIDYPSGKNWHGDALWQMGLKARKKDNIHAWHDAYHTHHIQLSVNGTFEDPLRQDRVSLNNPALYLGGYDHLLPTIGLLSKFSKKFMLEWKSSQEQSGLPPNNSDRRKRFGYLYES